MNTKRSVNLIESPGRNMNTANFMKTVVKPNFKPNWKPNGRVPDSPRFGGKEDSMEKLPPR
jgi:hypothetical protein